MGGSNAMASNRDASSGISLRDVALVWRDLGRDYGGDISSELVLPVRADSALLLHVRVHYRARRLGVRSVRPDCSVSGAWPNGDSRTLAGLLFRLSFDLGSKLESAPVADVSSEQARLWFDDPS